MSTKTAKFFNKKYYIFTLINDLNFAIPIDKPVFVPTTKKRPYDERKKFMSIRSLKFIENLFSWVLYVRVSSRKSCDWNTEWRTRNIR